MSNIIGVGSGLIGSNGARLKESPSGFVFMQDDCIDVDDTPLENHIISPINTGNFSWVKGGSEDRIISGNLISQPLVSSASNGYYVDIGERALTIEGKGSSTQTGVTDFCYLIVRYVDDDNFIAVLTQQFEALFFTASIVKVVAGATTFHGGNITSDSAYADTEQTFKITDDGHTITAYFAGHGPISYATDTFNYVTKIGIKNSNDATATWRDIIVSKT